MPLLPIDLSSIPPVTLSQVPFFAVPYLFSLTQNYIYIKYKDDPSARLVRLALLPGGLWAIWRSWLGMRFTDPDINILNFVYGCYSVYFIVVMTSNCLNANPPTRLDPSTSSPLLDACHITFSSRLIGWTSGTDPRKNPYPNLPPAEAHRKITRDHFWLFIYHYLYVDQIIWAFKYFGTKADGTGIGTPLGGDTYEAVERAWHSIREMGWGNTILEQATENGWTKWGFQQAGLTLISILMGLAFYQGLSMFWHLIAVVAMGVFGFDQAQWPDLFITPWKATSLRDFWSRRWHQNFRQAFVAPARLFPKRYRSIVAPFLAFSISSALHEFGAITMRGSISPNLVVLRSFILMGMGLTAEILFKKVTGRKVQGVWGWLWMWPYFTWAGRGLTWAWLDMGVGGSLLIPRRLSLMHWLMWGWQALQGKTPTWELAG